MVYPHTKKGKEMHAAVRRNDRIICLVLIIFCINLYSCATIKLIEGQVGVKDLVEKKTNTQIKYQYKIISGKEIKNGFYKSIKCINEMPYPYHQKFYYIVETSYLLGKKDGYLEEYYLDIKTNGKIPVRSALYKNDLLEGEYQEFAIKIDLYGDETSHLGYFKCNYLNGKAHGLYERYNKNGELVYTSIYENGNIITENSYSSFRIILTKSYYQNNKISKVEFFNRLGVLHSEIVYKNAKPFEGTELKPNLAKPVHDKIAYENGKIIKVESNFNIYGESLQEVVDAREAHFKKSKLDQAEYSTAIKKPISLKHEIGLNFLLIPPGDFVIGGPVSQAYREKDEKFGNMSVKQGFYLSETEVIQEVWEKFMHNNPSFDKGSNKPVTNVSWVEANEFVKKISEQYKSTFRLPTEIEFEYACRAGSNEIYYEDNLTEIAVLSTNNALFGHHDKVSKVKTKTPNQWGLYDMLGNVYEWCISDYVDYDEYKMLNQIISKSDIKIIRGGSYVDNREFLRMSDRAFKEKFYKEKNLGFRLLLEVDK